jgi:hypothetical protein
MTLQPFVGQDSLDGGSVHRKAATCTEDSTQKQNKHTDIHALGGIRVHDLSVRASEDSSCFRPRGRLEAARGKGKALNHDYKFISWRRSHYNGKNVILTTTFRTICYRTLQLTYVWGVKWRFYRRSREIVTAETDGAEGAIFYVYGLIYFRMVFLTTVSIA